MTYADAIRTAIVDETGAMAFLDALVVAGKSYHLEDSPHDISGPEGITFPGEEADLVSARVGEMYALPLWTRDDCPIGRMMEIEAKKAGFPSWEAMRDAQ
jgi:hypothetical protein